MSFRDVSLTGLLCLILAPCLWGGNFVVGSVLAADLPGLWMNLLRWCVALAVLVPFCGRAVWAHRVMLLRHWRALLILGALGVAGFNSTLYVALEYATLPMAAIAFAVTPFLILSISAVLDRRWPRARVLIAAALALSGMVLAQAEALTGDVAPIGVVLVLVSAVIWAGYSVALQRLTVPVPAEASFFGQVLAGTLLLAPVALVAAPMPSFDDVTPDMWLSIGYLGLCAGALAFWLWQHAIRSAGTARGSLFMNLVPISSMVLGVVFLGETLTRAEGFAVCVILFAIALSVRRDGGPRRPVLMPVR